MAQIRPLNLHTDPQRTYLFLGILFLYDFLMYIYIYIYIYKSLKKCRV